MKTTPKTHAIKLLAGAAALLALSGCASTGKFSCAAPEGVPCMSTQQVYEMTSGTGNALPERTSRRGRGQSGNFASHQVGAVGDSLALAAPAKVQHTASAGALALGSSSSYSQTTTASGALPPMGGYASTSAESIARVPAQVMRIWLAPWTDKAGDLHMPGYVYSEIKARRWSIGGDVRQAQSAANQFDPNAWQPSPAGTP